MDLRTTTIKGRPMLLNYLYTNFFEETQFADAVGTTTEDLHELIDAKVFPAPSYVYDGKGRSVSFVADFTDQQTYRFHLRGHTDWYRDITQLGLYTQARARDHFFNRYDHAKAAFLTSPLGVEFLAQAPAVAEQFDDEHANSTWGHFLNGVYGVCTRDGRPESVLLKQAGVMFIEQMIGDSPGKLSREKTELLRRAVDFLDGVESDFAPHEAPQSSRQRCIVDVRDQFFDMKSA
ncbi:DUF6058 family natural product biosynthesis protein [uncultured Tateyamaria sp.]|uniref:DUF6058 family natural product biosynthesis protein n=1 Tax=uncultured Tateyamaria sp. TaxID=455651 RepID=UPI002625B9E5|nr:DUF6058 family natural product biosynthesis protein [uncultured Tateyamaria sp.]